MLLDRKHRYQLYAAVMANLTTFAYGISLGWPSPILPLLQSSDSPFLQPLAIHEVSWLAALPLFGGMVATPFFGYSLERFGRKMTLLASAVPQIASWAILEFSSTALHLYAARILVGFGGTGLYLAIPMFVAEISSDDIRGALGTMLIVAKNLGLVVGYAINSYIGYYTVPFIVLGILAAFFIGFPLAADSPKHLMSQQRDQDALDALKYYRGFNGSDQQFLKEYAVEIAELKSFARPKSSESEKLSSKDFLTRSALKSILIGVVLIMMEVMNGFTAITRYSETIFQDTGSSLSPSMSTIMLGLIVLCGAYGSTLLVDRAGRKLLMTVSAMGCGISLSLVATYSLLKEHGVTVQPYSWIPLVGLSLFMLLGSVGIFTLNSVIISEVLTQKIRGIVFTALILESWIFGFVTVKFFPYLMAMIGMHGCLFAFATICLSGGLFVLLFLPETKGKSIEAIVRELEGK